MRILFAGSPEIALPSLEALAARHELVGVLTNPAAPRGRGLGLAPTPVAQRVAQLSPSLPILAPERLGPAEREAVAALRPEVLAVFAYGRIFGPKFLSLFPRGGINAHPSLLPRWRGCAPIPYAIMHGDSETGVSVQRVALRMDCGDVLARRVIPLDGTETAGSLSLVAAGLGAELLLEALALIEAGADTGEAQDEAAASYSAAISKDDGLIDWGSGAAAISARARAFDPWPGAWTLLGGERLAVLGLVAYPDEGADSPAEPGTVLQVDKSRGIMVKTGKGLAAITRLQARGKKPLPFRDFANGVRGLPGTRLGL